MEGGYKQLKVYQQAFELALQVHHETLNFPEAEEFELGSQLRKSSKSVAANITEGYGRGKKYKKDFAKFLINALGSIDETKVHLDFAQALNYLIGKNHQILIGNYNSLGKQVNSLIKTLNKE